MLKKKKIWALALALTLGLSSLAPVAQAQEAQEDQELEEEVLEIKKETKIQRLAGKSRVETALLASQGAYEQAEAVVLAGFAGEVDALTGTRLAAEKKAPLLLTAGTGLSDGLAQEIKRLGAKKVYILGGEASVSAAVVQDLEDLPVQVQRLSGKSRYETAAQLAGKKADHAFLALGRPGRTGDSLADALAIGPVSALKNSPVLLTEKDQLPAVTAQALKKLGVKRITIIGGLGSVSEQVAEELEKNYEIDRVAGKSRQATSLAIAKNYFDQPAHLLLVSGSQSADALVGGYYAALKNAPILLVAKDSIAQEIQAYIKEEAVAATILGGKNAVGDQVEKAFNKLFEEVEKPAKEEDPDKDQPQDQELPVQDNKLQKGPDKLTRSENDKYLVLQSASFNFNLFAGKERIAYLPGVKLIAVDRAGQSIDLKQVDVKVAGELLRINQDYRLGEDKTLVLTEDFAKSLALGDHSMEIFLENQLLFKQDLQVRQGQSLSFIAPSSLVVNKALDEDYKVTIEAYDYQGDLDNDVVIDGSEVNIKLDGHGVQRRYIGETSGGDFYIEAGGEFYNEIQHDPDDDRVGDYIFGAVETPSGIGRLVLTKECIQGLETGRHELKVMVRLGTLMEGYFGELVGTIPLEVVDLPLP